MTVISLVVHLAGSPEIAAEHRNPSPHHHSSIRPHEATAGCPRSAGPAPLGAVLQSRIGAPFSEEVRT
ncbi:hypothetical protein SAMN04487818_102193 [Actinokineospora terrae]|uniref:Uncharacterized protein n=1 Tax=Actinokineospora terrae TaxID=155974 RepID=A0A1H9MJG6_9PSEU|nr:hypothetical protein SAMN04487818_102193 [Actinokineospora terrae]